MLLARTENSVLLNKTFQREYAATCQTLSYMKNAMYFNYMLECVAEVRYILKTVLMCLHNSFY